MALFPKQANMNKAQLKIFLKKVLALLCVLILLLSICFYPSKETKIPYLGPAELDHSTSKMRSIFHKISDDVLYASAGMVLEPVSYIAHLGWVISLISPWTSTLGNELLLFSQLCHFATEHVLKQIFKETPSSSHLPSLSGVRPAHTSWHLNHKLLSQLPASSDEEKKLLFFLQKHWLSKVTGFYPLMVNWICPCFGMCIQIHPETTSSYVRNPWNKFSQTYTDVVKDWKQSLPHPQYYPLILTRPFDLKEFLPTCFEIASSEHISTIVEKLKGQTTQAKVIVDLTQVLPESIKDRTEWEQIWKAYRTRFLQKCKEFHLNPEQIICILKVRHPSIGGIRILPLTGPFADHLESHFQYLLEWISTFGLSANRIELDRYFSIHRTPSTQNAHVTPLLMEPKNEFLSYLDLFEQNLQSGHPHETLLIKGTLQVLKGLFVNLPEKKWQEVASSQTYSSVVQLSILNIKEQLKTLLQKRGEIYFFDSIEQIHANLSSLLEIFSPFSFEEFPSIYKDVLPIPPNLKLFTSCGVHAAGMTSLRGIFRAVEKTLGTFPYVLYGENTYFECINVAEQISSAIPVERATDEDLKQAGLILAQFNPVLRRIDFEIAEYRVERIAETLHKVLSVRREKPLTLALDCTIDFINSPRIGHLLSEFQKEIEMGQLNIICYRSGLKFDLFGMDNYCGAPFFMIHNQDPKWAHFDFILNDPGLQTDRLSFNWFCLAYKCAAHQLELYRKQIFDNTRALLRKVPQRLLHSKSHNYRIVPVEEGADLAFIDLKIFGPFHAVRGGVLAGGSLYLRCLEEGHPIFYRPSLGLYHPNFSMIFCNNFTTIRLTLGLDPAQIDILAKTFERIDLLNGPTCTEEVNAW